MLSPDSAALNLITLLEKGEHSYKLVTTVEGLIVDSKFKITADDHFKLTFTLQPEEQNKGIDLDYFFIGPFALATNGMTIHITNNKIIAGKRGLNEDLPCNYEIEVKSFKGDADDSLWKQSSQKAYIKYKRSHFNPYSSGLNFDLKTHLNDNGFFNAVNFEIDKKEFLFYHEAVDQDNGYFIINPKKKIDFDQLQSVVNTVMTAYGFLSGHYVMDGIYYVTLKEINGNKKTSFYYENFSASIHSNKPILDSGNYPDIPNDKRLLSSKQFQQLVNILFHNQDYLRSVYLLIEAGTLTGCAQASLGAVALETISKHIQESNTTGSIIDDKEISKGLIYKLNKVLKDYSNILDVEQLTIFKNKISSINSRPNSSKLMSAFGQMSITLSEDEQECVKSRNLFLHGNLPKDKDVNLSDQELLGILANRLVMLSSMLMLKLSGFDGYVIDRGMTEVIKWRMIKQGHKVNGGSYLRNISEAE